MRIACRWTVALLLSAAAAVVLAQAPSLDVKMGLWEITSTMDMGGQMPAMDTSRMTPEQRAQVEAMMKNMTGAHPTVVKTCITKEKFDRSSFATEQPGTTCTQNITTNTSSTLEATVSCKGGAAVTSRLHIDALSSTSIKGSFTVATSEQGRGMNMNSTMTGQWLGADCGNVK